MLVSDIVRGNAEYFPEADAVVAADGATRSWAELDTRTNRLANAFGRLGLRKGDRVAIYARNCPEYIDFFFACAKSGVVGAAVNIRLSATEVGSYLSYVEPDVVLVHAGEAQAASAWLDKLDHVRHVVGFGGRHPFAEDLEDLIADGAPTAPDVEVVDTDVYQLAATSGTTGVPKAAMMTHRNAMAAMLNWLSEMPVPALGTALQCIPHFFNPGGPAGLHPVMMKGGRVVIPEQFSPQSFVELVHTYSVTHTILVPTMLQMVLSAPGATADKLSSLQGVITGGSPLSASLLGRGREVIGDVFYPIYGMAEMYACAMILRPQDQFTGGTEQQRRHLSSVGKPMVLTRARVVGENGNDVATDGRTPGEIWLAGDPVFDGYFRMPEETQRSRQDGWFKSGDVAVVDEEHFVTIVDRLKDMIITGGINVFSIEVEQALMQHPAVVQAAVIGMPHEKWGETIHAVVVRKDDASVDAEELIEFVGGLLASYKKPRSVEFVSALPISGTGKVLKRVLREDSRTGNE